MPAKHNAIKGVGRKTGSVVFISKATREDDDFVLWPAPRLGNARQTAFAGILTSDPDEHWRQEIIDTLQNQAVKMLLGGGNSTRSTMKGADLRLRVTQEGIAC